MYKRQEWYKLDYHDSELHELAVYGLPELYRAQIKGADIIGNPGCYPTSIALALAPLMKLGLVNEQHIIIDAKSGTTGAGKGLSDNTQMCIRDRYDILPGCTGCASCSQANNQGADHQWRIADAAGLSSE